MLSLVVLKVAIIAEEKENTCNPLTQWRFSLKCSQLHNRLNHQRKDWVFICNIYIIHEIVFDHIQQNTICIHVTPTIWPSKLLSRRPSFRRWPLFWKSNLMISRAPWKNKQMIQCKKNTCLSNQKVRMYFHCLTNNAKIGKWYMPIWFLK